MAYLADYAACLDADIRTSRSAPSSPRSTEPAATTRTEPESSSYRGTAAPKPIGIGVGAPAGLGSRPAASTAIPRGRTRRCLTRRNRSRDTGHRRPRPPVPSPPVAPAAAPRPASPLRTAAAHVDPIVKPRRPAVPRHSRPAAASGGAHGDGLAGRGRGCSGRAGSNDPGPSVTSSPGWRPPSPGRPGHAGRVGEHGAARRPGAALSALDPSRCSPATRRTRGMC